MASNLFDTLSLTWNRLQDLVLDLLSIGSLEQETRASWAKLVRTYADIPENFQDFFAALAVDEQPFPYVVLTPSYEGYLHRTTEKLVCSLGPELYILEADGNSFTTVCYPLEEISYVEVRTALLDSCIKISGLTRQGEPVGTTFRFNTVTDHLFSPILESIRLAGTDAWEVGQVVEKNTFAHWAKANFKFMNYARRSLLGNETVVQAILQPEIRVRFLSVFGRTYYRTASPPHVAILTNRELIVIREEQRRDSDRYGGVWNYIPLDKIAALALDRREDGLLALTIQLPGDEQLTTLFHTRLEPELGQLLDKFREAKGA